MSGFRYVHSKNLPVNTAARVFTTWRLWTWVNVIYSRWANHRWTGWLNWRGSGWWNARINWQGYHWEEQLARAWYHRWEGRSGADWSNTQYKEVWAILAHCSSRQYEQAGQEEIGPSPSRRGIFWWCKPFGKHSFEWTVSYLCACTSDFPAWASARRHLLSKSLGCFWATMAVITTMSLSIWTTKLYGYRLSFCQHLQRVYKYSGVGTWKWMGRSTS